MCERERGYRCGRDRETEVCEREDTGAGERGYGSGREREREREREKESVRESDRDGRESEDTRVCEREK